MISGKASRLYGDGVKLIEIVNPKTPTGQFNITISMNSHMQRIHNSIAIV